MALILSQTSGTEAKHYRVNNANKIPGQKI
jgi:hypothetical protein